MIKLCNKVILAVMISAPILALADTAIISNGLINAQTITEECKDCNPKESRERKSLLREEYKKTISDANAIVPGIEAQWIEVKKEQHELIKALIAKGQNRSDNKDVQKNQKEGFNKNWKNSLKPAWDNFYKAVASKNKEEIQSTFSKLLSINKEINESLKAKISSN